MNARKTRALPVSLENVQRRFTEWRRTHRARSPLASSLWVAAVKMAGKYGLNCTARALRVDYYSLKKRMEQRSTPAKKRQIGANSHICGTASASAGWHVRLHPGDGGREGSHHAAADEDHGAARSGRALPQLPHLDLMIQITPQMRILVAVEPSDFRRGIDGLARVCKEVLQRDPFSGCMFVFRNRPATALKILVYDGQGFWLCHKRLSKGKFAWWPRRRSGTDPGGPRTAGPLGGREPGSHACGARLAIGRIPGTAGGGVTGRRQSMPTFAWRTWLGLYSWQT